MHSADSIRRGVEEGLIAIGTATADRTAWLLAVERLLGLIDRHWRGRDYFACPPQVQAAETELLDGRDPGFAAELWQGVLLRCMQHTMADRLSVFTPEQIGRIHAQFGRILEFVARNAYVRPEQAIRRNDLFVKDLGIARATMLPTTGRLIDRYSRIPRRPMVTGLPASATFYWKALVDLGGLSPYFGVHLHAPMRDAYVGQNDQRTAFLDSVAEIGEYLERMPEVRGTLGYGWLMDPAMAWVSPRQAHVHHIAAAYGARFLDLGFNQETVRSALSQSKTRQQLHAEGKYQPRDYLRLWARNDVLRCVRDYRSGTLKA
jgi:hypothetical protein